MTSNRHVTVWIDHDEARLFHIDAETFSEQTVRAPNRHVHRHPKGSAAEHRHPADAHQFFAAVLGELEGAERVLVVGPSTAKLQFIHYAYQHNRTLEPRIIGVETVESSDRRTAGRLLAALFCRRRQDAGATEHREPPRLMACSVV